MNSMPKRKELGTTRATPELEQETRRVLRRLAESDGYIAEHAPDLAGVFVKRNGFKRPVLTLALQMVTNLRAAGLIEPRPGSAGGYVTSAAGAAFLVRASAGDDGFQRQHRLMEKRSVVGDAGEGTAPRVSCAVNVGESPLGWLARRRDPSGQPLITAEQYAAGERLREDYARGQLMARVTLDWSRPIASGGGSGGETLTDAALAARRRVNAAIEAVGPGLSDVLIETCCHLRGLEEAERALNYPPRTGKVVIRIALERLAQYYKMGAETRPGRTWLRAWHAEEDVEDA